LKRDAARLAATDFDFWSPLASEHSRTYVRASQSWSAWRQSSGASELALPIGFGQPAAIQSERHLRGPVEGMAGTPAFDVRPPE
jgi:hypothetical protein